MQSIVRVLIKKHEGEGGGGGVSDYPTPPPAGVGFTCIMNMRLWILMVIFILHLQNTLLLNTVTYIHAHTYTYICTHTHADADFQYLERFVCSAYDIQCRFNTNDINKLLYLLFLKLCENNLRRLPPTRDALHQHILSLISVLRCLWPMV